MTRHFTVWPFFPLPDMQALWKAKKRINCSSCRPPKPLTHTHTFLLVGHIESALWKKWKEKKKRHAQIRTGKWHLSVNGFLVWKWRGFFLSFSRWEGDWECFKEKTFFPGGRRWDYISCLSSDIWLFGLGFSLLIAVFPLWPKKKKKTRVGGVCEL